MREGGRVGRRHQMSAGAPRADSTGRCLALTPRVVASVPVLGLGFRRRGGCNGWPDSGKAPG